MKHYVKRKLLAVDGDRLVFELECLWCGATFPPDEKAGVGWPQPEVHGDGPPCTLGVSASDAAAAGEQLK